MSYKFEKFQRPILLDKEELKKALEELKTKDPDTSLVINRAPGVIYHQAKLLGIKVSVSGFKNSKSCRVWIK